MTDEALKEHIMATSQTHETPARRLADAVVADCMHHGIIDCPPDARVADLAALMAEHRVHCVVVDGLRMGRGRGEHLVWGLVSDLDLLRAAGDDALTAADLAAGEAITVEPGEPLHRAAQLMVEHQTAHLVVVSPADGRPTGVISSLDVAGAMR